MVFTVYPLRA